MAEVPSNVTAPKTTTPRTADAPAAKAAPKGPRTITVLTVMADGPDGKPLDRFRWTPDRAWPVGQDGITVVEVVEPTQAKHPDTGELLTLDGKPLMDLGDPKLENGRPHPHKIGQRTYRQLKGSPTWWIVTEGGTIKAAAAGGDDKARILSLEAQIEELKAMFAKIAVSANG